MSLRAATPQAKDPPHTPGPLSAYRLSQWASSGSRERPSWAHLPAPPGLTTPRHPDTPTPRHSDTQTPDTPTPALSTPSCRAQQAHHPQDSGATPQGPGPLLPPRAQGPPGEDSPTSWGGSGSKSPLQRTRKVSSLRARPACLQLSPSMLDICPQVLMTWEWPCSHCPCHGPQTGLMWAERPPGSCQEGSWEQQAARRPPHPPHDGCPAGKLSVRRQKALLSSSGGPLA